MARILFDREISQITPIQALQLAGAINEMMGRRGFDPLAYTRNLIGVDWLQVKQSGESPGESALSAGKYLGDSIYVEVEKGISAESGKVSVKWELTPRITVDTSVGENADTEMGINFKLDY
jgi:translocation and assembly module TamB